MLFDAPIRLDYTPRVKSEWIDYNGHMNVAFYVLAFDEALDRIHDKMGLGRPYREQTDHSTFALEAHVHWLQEMKLDDPMRFTVQLLDRDNKRMHLFLLMEHGNDGYVAATYENLLMHVDLRTRRSSPFPQEVQARIDHLFEAHQPLKRPDSAGNIIGIRRPKNLRD